VTGLRAGLAPCGARACKQCLHRFDLEVATAVLGGKRREITVERVRVGLGRSVSRKTDASTETNRTVHQRLLLLAHTDANKCRPAQMQTSVDLTRARCPYDRWRHLRPITFQRREGGRLGNPMSFW
jgi:hypothetical protein